MSFVNDLFDRGVDYYVTYISSSGVGYCNIKAPKPKKLADIITWNQYISEKYCDKQPVTIINWKKY